MDDYKKRQAQRRKRQQEFIRWGSIVLLFLVLVVIALPMMQEVNPSIVIFTIMVSLMIFIFHGVRWRK